MISLFPFLKVKYEFESIGMCHYIEVLPAKSYHTNLEYIKFEISLEENFSDFFENEDVCFLTAGSLYEIKNPIYTNEGVCYGENGASQDPLIIAGYDFEFPVKAKFWETGVNFNFSQKEINKFSDNKTFESKKNQEDDYSEVFYTQAA
ncbi:MAG: hypothetical protein IPQ23_02550 [Cytophagaceae bacterium]|nr:hypothetical protein [Cytophagaceae bacterium]